jgi:hypothetical protein
MKKYYVITVSNGDKYGIPAEIIAKNRADSYGDDVDSNEWKEEFNGMMKWFDTDEFEFADWAKNNMDWDEVKEHAVLLKRADPPDIDFQECWVNGEYEYLTIESEEKSE